MKDLQRIVRSRWSLGTALAFLAALTGCGPHYSELRLEGQRAMLRAEFNPARYFFEKADERGRNRVENLHDLGFCSMMLAKERLEQGNRPSALRELDRALDYYNRAIEVQPGHQASLVGKNLALELKGLSDAALDHAEWAAKIVGPSARQHLFLASELEERGDLDGALLRYQQAVAMEPGNAEAHIAIAKFLLRHSNEQAAVGHLQIAYRLNPRNQWVAQELIARGKLPTLAPTDNPAP